MTRPPYAVPLKPDFSARRSTPHLERAAFATVLSAEDPGMRGPAKIAKELWPSDEVTPLLTRSSISPATTTTSTWAKETAGQATAEFVFSLAPMSAAARLIAAAGMRVSLAGVESALIPRRQDGAMPATDVAWIPQSGPIPVRKIPIDAVQVGPARKLGNITCMTGELSRSVNGEQVFAQLLRENFARSLDASMFSDFSSDGVQPSGLLDGVTPLTASSATNPTDAMLEDLENLAASIGENGGSNVVYVMAPPAGSERAPAFAQYQCRSDDLAMHDIDGWYHHRN